MPLDANTRLTWNELAAAIRETVENILTGRIIDVSSQRNGERLGWGYGLWRLEQIATGPTRA